VVALTVHFLVELGLFLTDFKWINNIVNKQQGTLL